MWYLLYFPYLKHLGSIGAEEKNTNNRYRENVYLQDGSRRSENLQKTYAIMHNET